MSDYQSISAQAMALHRAGKYPDAIALYREALLGRPGEPSLVYMLGVALLQNGDLAPALEHIRKAVSARPEDRRFRSGLATALRVNGRPRDAAGIYRQLLADDDEGGRLWLALGDALHGAGQMSEAIEALEHATRCYPELADAHALLGRSYAVAGQDAAAIEALSEALRMRPENPGYRQTLADLLMSADQTARAVEEYRSLVETRPGDAETLSKFGVALAKAGREDEARNALRRAADLAPNNGQIIFRLGRFLAQAGRIDESVLVRWLNLERPVSHILRTAALEWLAGSTEIRDWADRPVSHGGRQEDLKRLTNSPILSKVLRRTIIDEPVVERAMTAVRRFLCSLSAMNAEGVENLIALAGDLAMQCHFNEYVFPESASERQDIVRIERRMEEMLAQDMVPDAFAIAVLASYRPLDRYAWAGEFLRADRPWGLESLSELIRLQVGEPAQEARLKHEIPCLRVSESTVSRKVRQQYEEHPYPRWTETPTLPGGTLQTVLLGLFPFLASADVRWPDAPDILIAGCGTGLHSMITAQRFPDASILAVDLSLASLAHALRRTREAGVGNLEYAQADILALPDTGRRFDVIESSGVLHHMEDPLEGWARLVEMLRPGGFMKIGLYSEQGRKPVVAARQFIRAQDFAGTDEGIREARQAIMDLPADHLARRVLKRPDFYATSACRDLLFHVQEHRFELDQIDAMLKQLRLEFVGFELAGALAKKEYRRRYPDDPDMRDLSNWAEFEKDRPETFAGMYLFWARLAVKTPEGDGSKVSGTRAQ
jgi:Flp pilus assembly protein TadD/2-polyprenyl-3-methyl-5-hydroxy-6-metoxy-1,4-benzoquinol methylase